MRPEWVLTAELREKALAKRHLSRHTDLSQGSKPLKPLDLGCVVQVQNQRGQHASKWDFSGTIVEVQNFDSYLVKMDGTGRVTKRNRRFLRPIIPFGQEVQPGLPLQQYEGDFTRQDRQHQHEHNSKAQDDTSTVQDTEIQMSDADFDSGLTKVAQNVQREQPKRVKFQTKRYIQEY